VNIQQRLTALERQPANDELHGIPIKPVDWTDGEHTAVVKGLGLYGLPILALTNDTFLSKYQTYIDQIRADYNDKDITPDKLIVKARWYTFAELVEHQRARYVL